MLELWKFTKKRDLIDQGKLKLLAADTRGHWLRRQCAWAWRHVPSIGSGTSPAGFGPAVASSTLMQRVWQQPCGSGAIRTTSSTSKTSAVAIPFRRGQQPYETVAFQFSHHVMRAGGRVEHANQCLEVEPGVDPTLAFLRKLRAALGGDSGTVFRWATHENTVLNQLRARLLAEAKPAPDSDELVAFIESITSRKADGVEIAGPRSMVDLCKLAELHYFHPSTKGSNSLKKVLPALMQSSDFLRDLYGQPVYGTPAMPSMNLKSSMVWWRQEAGVIADPYDPLPPVFGHLTTMELAALDAGVDESCKPAAPRWPRTRSFSLKPWSRRNGRRSRKHY